MNPMLRLCEDVFTNDSAMELPALPRMIFVVHGSVAIGERTLRNEEAFGGEGAIMLWLLVRGAQPPPPRVATSSPAAASAASADGS